MWISSKDARKEFKITTNTFIRWASEGKIKFYKTETGRYFYDKQSIEDYCNKPITTMVEIEKGEKICYCRVSSRKQKDDLQRQKEYFSSKYPGYRIITDIRSGINWKRKGLLSILELSMQKKLQEVVVAHRDRLSRMAFEPIEWILERGGTKLIVEDTNEFKSKETELSEDIMSIITIYACRENGRRRYKNKENTIEVNSESEEDD